MREESRPSVLASTDGRTGLPLSWGKLGVTGLEEKIRNSFLDVTLRCLLCIYLE